MTTSSTTGGPQDAGKPTDVARVLVIDQEPIIGDVITAALKSGGHKVTACRTAEEATLQLYEGAFDVVFLHRNFSIEVARDLVRTARSRAQRTAVLLLVSHAVQDAEKMRLRVGADEIIHKPINPFEIRAAVAKYHASPADSYEVPDLPRVMVVDDDNLVLASVRDALKRDYHVSALSSPLETLKQLKAGPYEILVADLMMDEMDGIDLIRSARAIRPWIVPVVMTGYGSKESVITALKEGAFDFLEKPLTPALVRQAVARGWRALRTELENRRLIEELRHKNAQLARARDAAEAATQAKSQILANTSHEIRTPLNGVIGMTSLLQRTQLTAEQRNYVEKIRLSGELLMAVIEDVLDLSKIEAGKLALQQVDFDLPPVVEGVVQLLMEKATDKRLRLACEIDPEVPRWVSGDPARLRQLLANLLTNAIKFTDGGEVRVRVRRLADKDEVASVRFEVVDTGIGLPPEARERIFDSFQQVDGASTRRHGGTGLGLAIAKELVELMHGEIGVESQVGEGSTFWFTLPLPRRAEVVAAPEAGFARMKGLRVLVVDSSEPADLIDGLRSWGMVPHWASDGSGALQALRDGQRTEAPFGLALIQRHMPGIDGPAMVRAVKSDPSIGTVPLVILSSGTERGDSAMVQQLGASGHLSNSMNTDDLRGCIASVLASPTAFVSYENGTVTIGRRRITEQVAGIAAHVLVVEDNEINREIIVSMLSKLRCAADVAANGVAALDHFGQRTYDMVLMDCAMPEMDGFAATAKIREQEGDRRHTPVIALTALAMVGDRDRCIAAGMDDVLTKPLMIEDLHAAVERWTGKAIKLPDE